MYILSSVRTERNDQTGHMIIAPLFSLLTLDEKTSATLLMLRDHVREGVKAFGEVITSRILNPICEVGLYHDPLFAVSNAHFGQRIGEWAPIGFAEGETIEELLGLSAEKLA